jgi:hypothetical protein
MSRVQPHKMAFKTLEDLRIALPAMVKMLDVVCEPGDEHKFLEILYPDVLKMDYMESHKFKDRVVKVQSIDGNLPPIRLAGNQHANVMPVIGLTLFECRGKPGLRYVKFYARDYNDYGTQYIVVPKGRVFALKRHVNASNKNYRKIDCRPPILEDGLLAKLYDNTIGFLMHAEEMEVHNISLRRGILLTGECGNGKSMLCGWLKQECESKDISCGSVDGANITHQFGSGGGLEALFTKFTVTIFDDFDIALFSRKSGKSEIACSLLTAMDGIDQDKKDHRIRIFTTNEPIDDFDPAFLRPGRIDCCFEFNKPTINLRKKLIEEFWSPEIVAYLNEKKELDNLLADTDNLTFAEVEAIRSFLIMHKISQGPWDIRYALDAFHQRHGQSTLKMHKKKVGFEK